MTTTQAVRKLSDTASVSVARLKAVWAPLKRVLAFSPADDLIAPKKGLAVSLERGGASVVYGSRFLSRITLRGMTRYSFEADKYPQPEDLASSVAMEASKRGAIGTDVTLSIPKAWAIIKTAEFPSTVKENLPDVVSYEIDRLTPFMPEDSLFDFQTVEEKGGRLTILLMAAKAEMVDPYIRALGEHGLNVGTLTVDLSGIGTICRYANKGEDIISARIDEQGFEGALLSGGVIEQSISVSGPISEGGEKLDRVIGEIRGMLDTAKSRGRKLQVVALFSNVDPSLKESMGQRLDCPIKMLGKSDLRLTFQGEVLPEIPYATVGSLLESLWPGAKGLNLLKKGKYETPRKPVALSVLLILAILAVGALNLTAPLRLEEQRLQTMTQQLDAKKTEVRKVEALKKEVGSLRDEISTINTFKEGGPLKLSLLKELTTIIPKTTWLTRVRMTETTVQIEGYSDSATSLLPKLEASPYLQKVEFASPTFRDRRMNADRFNIKMEIEGLKGSDNGKVKKETKAGDEKK